MKKIISISLLICFMYSYSIAQLNPPRLIVRGDDMGFSHSGNEALIKCYKEGIETSIEVIVPSPWFPEAVRLLAENPGVDVGVHLAITSEWDNIKWRPLTDCKSIKDGNGYFFPRVNISTNYPGQTVADQKWDIKDIEKEFRAQVELALKLIPRISHFTAHMGCTNLSEDVKKLANKIAIDYNIPLIPEQDNAIKIGYAGPHKTLEEKMESFIKMLNSLEPGKTYMFLDHPGFDNAELRAIYHVGYEDVAQDRQGVTDLFTNKEIQAVIKEKGIQLISYKDLIEK